MRRLAEALSPSQLGEWFLHFLSLNDDYQSLANNQSLRHCTSLRGASRSKWRLLRHLLGLPRLDLLVVGHLGPSPLGLLLKKARQVQRYVIVLHGVEAWHRASWLSRVSARYADAIVATTTYTARAFARRNGVAEARTRIIPLCADESPVVPSAGFRLHGGFKLLCVARQAATERLKGFEMIFEALARISGTPEPHLNLVGDGDDQQRLKALVSKLGIQGRVTFWGALDDTRLAAAYEDCDVFVMPSKKEGFGIVFLEAMLRAKPCIGGAHGGTPEVIRHGETGYLVKYGDIGALIRYLDLLRKDPELRQRLGARGREFLRTHFSATAFRERWRKLVADNLWSAGDAHKNSGAITATSIDTVMQ